MIFIIIIIIIPTHCPGYVTSVISIHHHHQHHPHYHYYYYYCSCQIVVESEAKATNAVIIQSIIKMADIGYNCKPKQQHDTWSNLLKEEMYIQGDTER